MQIEDDFVNEIYSELAIGQINKIDNSHLEAIENVYYKDYEYTGYSWKTIKENLNIESTVEEMASLYDIDKDDNM